MFYRLQSGFAINVMDVSYITPPDKGVCRIYLSGEDGGFEANPFEAEDIIQMVGDLTQEVLAGEDDDTM